MIQFSENNLFDRPKIHHDPSNAPVIGILTGEGIGSELMTVCRGLLAEISLCTGLKLDVRTGGMIGMPAWHETGEWVTPEVEDFCRSIHKEGGAIMCGPGGGRFVYELRRQLKLFCKLVPLKPTYALREMGPLKAKVLDGVDMVVVRENLGGVYQGRHTENNEKNDQRIRYCFEYTKEQVKDILHVGVRLAGQRRGKLCVIYKPGGVPGVSDLWRNQATDLCQDSNIQLKMLEVDNASFQMIADAKNFDVVVAPNMFGDILADGSSILLGSRGMSFSANFSEDGIGVYQTGHGAAHDLAETDQANPIGQIYSMAFMLREHFGLERIAKSIEAAVESVLAAGWRTADIVEPGSRVVGTRRMGELIAESVRQQIGQT